MTELELLAQDRQLSQLIDRLIKAARHELFENPDESAERPVERARQALEEYIEEIRAS
jgi:hypothetical protein